MHIKEINVKNRVYNYYFDSLVKPIFSDLVIYLTRHIYSNSIKVLNLHNHELMGKIEEH